MEVTNEEKTLSIHHFELQCCDSAVSAFASFAHIHGQPLDPIPHFLMHILSIQIWKYAIRFVYGCCGLFYHLPAESQHCSSKWWVLIVFASFVHLHGQPHDPILHSFWLRPWIKMSMHVAWLVTRHSHSHSCPIRLFWLVSDITSQHADSEHLCLYCAPPRATPAPHEKSFFWLEPYWMS